MCLPKQAKKKTKKRKKEWRFKWNINSIGILSMLVHPVEHIASLDAVDWTLSSLLRANVSVNHHPAVPSAFFTHSQSPSVKTWITEHRIFGCLTLLFLHADKVSSGDCPDDFYQCVADKYNKTHEVMGINLVFEFSYINGFSCVFLILRCKILHRDSELCRIHHKQLLSAGEDAEDND